MRKVPVNEHELLLCYQLEGGVEKVADQNLLLVGAKCSCGFSLTWKILSAGIPIDVIKIGTWFREHVEEIVKRSNEMVV